MARELERALRWVTQIKPALTNVSKNTIIQAVDLRKSFPGVLAIRRGHLEVVEGEVHALMGENGAGKSTLIKILSGAHAPDGGSIRWEGKGIQIRSPHEARRMGIAVIYQEFNLVPGLSVRENLFLGQEISRWGWLQSGREMQQAREIFNRFGLDLDFEMPCGRLSVAEQQLVEIAKAMVHQARLVIMDEPTAALSDKEVKKLFRIVRDLRDQGLGIVYVSHRLDEVFALCDRVTVMRDGEHIATRPVGEWTRQGLIESMVGRKLESEFPQREANLGEVRLEVKGLNLGRKVRNVTFSARRGEIVGIAGLVGAGRTEMARLLFGADPAESGQVILDGKALRIRSPREAIRHGIALLTEDRKHQGLVLGLSVRDNFGLPNLRSFSRWGWLNQRKERREIGRYVEQLQIKLANPDHLARNLSGGNQQKVVLAKWLEANAEVIVFDEPTRGVDVGAKFEIYQLMNELSRQGKVILMISSELPEILGMSDRILVMREGRLSGEIREVRRASQEDVLSLATQ